MLLQVVRVLAECGAQLDVGEMNDEPPILHAVVRNRTAVVRVSLG
jgi:hypothetical protein